MVGYLTSTDRYFRISNGEAYRGTESHIGIGGKWGPDLGGDLDGASWQWQDLAYGADANLDGKDRVISFETADNAPATPDQIAEWTPKQVDEIVRFLDWVCSPKAHAKCPASWLCHQVGIPRALIPDSKPGRRGIGYHAQGAAERVAGGERWSTSDTKPCPAWRRIRQLKTIIVPRVAAGGAPIEEDDMAADPEVLAALEKIADRVDAATAKIDSLYTAGFKGQAGGVNSAAHEEVSIRGVNAQLNAVSAGLGETNRLLALIEERTTTPEPAP